MATLVRAFLLTSLLVVALAGVAFAIGWLRYGSPDHWFGADKPTEIEKAKAVAQRVRKRTPDVAVTADAMIGTYANESAGDERFRDKTVRVTGRVGTVHKDVVDGIDARVLTIEGGLHVVVCVTVDEYDSDLAQLKPGQGITVKGLGARYDRTAMRAYLFPCVLDE